MREILFRGQRVDTKEWVFGSLVKVPIKQDLYNTYRIYYQPFEGASSNTYHQVIPETVGQFTGLTDKNGTKIFEGDITNAGIEGALARVIYIDGAFQYKYLKKPQKPDIYRFEYHKMNTHEVVANIHDNPELLKGGQ